MITRSDEDLEREAQLEARREKMREDLIRRQLRNYIALRRGAPEPAVKRKEDGSFDGFGSRPQKPRMSASTVRTLLEMDLPSDLRAEFELDLKRLEKAEAKRRRKQKR